MTVRFIANHTVEVLTAVVETNSVKATVKNWDDATAVEVDGCSFQPAQGGEDNRNRSAVQYSARLFMPDGTAIEATDRVLHKGRTYEVASEPLRHEAGLMTDHVEVNLNVWKG